MSQDNYLIAIKVCAMLINFSVVYTVGILPLKSKAFKENKLLLSLSAAFAGGLFFSVGFLHLLPESNISFEKYFQSQSSSQIQPSDEKFPWAFLISVLSFTLILFIEKILTDNHHSHGDDQHSPISLSRENSNDDKLNLHQHLNVNNNNNNNCSEDLQVQDQINQQNCIIQRLQIQQQQLQKQQNGSSNEIPPIIDDENIEEIEINMFKEQINTQTKVANKINFHERLKLHYTSLKLMATEALEHNLQPYILSIAIGIHAVFEGLAVGIQTEWMTCLGIALAVLIHKAAEGFTLGIAFKNANVNVKMAQVMIFIQASMDPIGIMTGWILSSQGSLIQGIFTSISVGTFIYIATVEIIVEEFNLKRYRWLKFLVFILAIGFSCLLWYIEKLATSN